MSVCCLNCNHWEWGHCPVFNKSTRANHGSQCTAHEAILSNPNAAPAAATSEHLRHNHSISGEALHCEPSRGFDTFTPVETVTVDFGKCPPKTWAWLQSKFPGCPSVRLIVHSSLNEEFSRRFVAELRERKAAFERLNGPITWLCAQNLFKAGKL